MKAKFTYFQFLMLGILTFFITAIIGAVLLQVHLPYDSVYTVADTKGLISNQPGDIAYGALHTIVAWFYWICWVAGVITFIVNMIDSGGIFWRYIDDSDEKSDDSVSKNSSLKFYIKWALSVTSLLILFGFIKSQSQNVIELYNTSVQNHAQYTQKVQEKVGFADKMWSTYLQKEKITNVNKDVFIEVTKLIMENRKDGQNVAWKWLQENQQIDYNEFTKFYADLTQFVASQREGYFNIEKECQAIANKQNVMLDVFPNNVYNRIVKCKPIDYKPGFLSEKTIATFKSGVEK